jgi:hypothetical protein
MAQLRSLMQAPRDRVEAGLRFVDLVGNRGPWDIKREFPRWVRDPVKDVEYGSDLWGNLHYGYLGKAAGFTETELWIGAEAQAWLATGCRAGRSAECCGCRRVGAAWIVGLRGVSAVQSY